MKKIYLVLIALTTLISLQSCEKSGNRSEDLGHVRVFLLVNKQSDLYKDMEKAFTKNDYTETNGFNNVYFLQNGKKQKLRYSLGDKHKQSFFSGILYEHIGIPENYAYLVGSELNNQELFTNKDEKILLKYDDKKLSLKIKGKFGNNYSFAKVEHFYVNDKKMKILKSHFTHNVVLFLTE